MTANGKINCVLSLIKICIDFIHLACRIWSKCISSALRSFPQLFSGCLLKYYLLPLCHITLGLHQNVLGSTEHSLLFQGLLFLCFLYEALLLLKISYICFILQKPAQIFDYCKNLSKITSIRKINSVFPSPSTQSVIFMPCYRPWLYS